MFRSISVAAVVSTLVTLTSCARPVRVQPPAAPPATAMRSLIPAPVSAEFAAGAGFVVTPETIIVVPPNDVTLRRLGQYLADFIGMSTGPTAPRVQVADGSDPAGSVHLALGTLSQPGAEAYELTISPERVTIVASEAAGIFYGIQTFRQLLPPFVEHEAVRPSENRPVSAPEATISDHPRFPWRGAMLDVSRHFVRPADVKRYIDLMALYKLNRLHLHLSDDQGWRLEIKSWPNLTRHGGKTQVGGGAGGSYTQDEYADLAAYAQDRFITIVPEIDMPGHTNAALASYAELNCDDVARPLYTGIEVGFSALCVEREVTYRFIDDVVREIGALTPGPYFHVGGDEVKTLTDEQYVRFIERVQGIVRAHGKQMVGWDEIAPADLHPTSIVQHWRPDTTPAVALSKGVKFILSPANKVYLDMKYHEGTALGLAWAGHVEVRDAYDWDPATALPNVPESALLGVEAPLWSETLVHIHEFEHMAFPRLPAIAEIGWTPAAVRRWEDFRVRLGAQAPRWSALGVNFYRSTQVEWEH